MGSSFNKSIGPRSGYRPDSSTNVEIDYRNPAHAEKAKRELYTLFLDGKIVHISNLEELQSKINKLLQEQSRIKQPENHTEEAKRPMKMENKVATPKSQATHM